MADRSGSRGWHTPFFGVRIRARSGGLSPAARPHAAYLASDEFIERMRFADTHDSLIATLYLLDRLALEPRDTARHEGDAGRGLFNFNYFGVSNPIPMFSLPVGGPEHAQIVAAVRRNQCGPMAAAAQAALRQREPRAAARRGAWEERVLDRVRARMQPTRDDYDRDRALAQQMASDAAEAVEAKRMQLRDSRISRLARLSAAATPGCSSWYQLLEGLAVHVATHGEPSQPKDACMGVRVSCEDLGDQQPSREREHG